MKLFLVIGESHVYQPNFVAEFLRRTTDEVVGAALVTKAPIKTDMIRYLLTHINKLIPVEIIGLAIDTFRTVVLNLLPRDRNSCNFYSVRAVYKAFNIPFFEVADSINKSDYLEKITSLKPDVIISSNPLIFKAPLLAVPTKCCLNRHSSLLPACGGLWPIFHAVRLGSIHTGTSIHIMMPGIDQGAVLAQGQVEIQPSDTLRSLYAKTYTISAGTLLKALDKVRVSDYTPISSSEPASYFSNPTDNDWMEFRKRGGKF